MSKMNLTATYHKRVMNFTEQRFTSRGAIEGKVSFFIVLDNGKNKGIGECSYLAGLSPENYTTYENKIIEVCNNINNYEYWLRDGLTEYPSIQMGLETAIADVSSTKQHLIFPSNFTTGKSSIKINGLIWMDSFDKMKAAIDDKINKGFTCIKLKIGAIDFEKELELLHYIRSKSTSIEIRVDANGAFTPDNALTKLQKLKKYNIHSIEQPIKPKQWDDMNKLISSSHIPIALDEELIGLYTYHEKETMMKAIRPYYIILKPSLIGGFKGSKEWIELANKYQCKWWITSCLETNIGLNAIAQFVAQYDNPLPQGLGTGQIYTNNIPSGLNLTNDQLTVDLDNWPTYQYE